MESRKISDGIERAVLNAIAKTFHTLIIINLKNNSFEIFNTNDKVQNFVSGYDDAKRAMYETVSSHIIPLHRKKVVEFTDLSTIDERLREAKNNILTESVISVYSGWIRLEFFPIDYDENGKIVHIAFSIEEMSNVKGWMEQCVEISETDEMTGVYNLTAFSKKVVDISMGSLPPEMGVIVLKLHTKLFVFGENISHEHVDLLRHFAAEFKEAFASMKGSLYRTSDNEFICIFNATVEDSKLINEKMAKLEKDYMEELNFSYGISLQDKLKLNSVDHLIKYAQYDANIVR